MMLGFRQTDYQTHLDTRAVELAAATQERQIRHEKICGERYEENRDVLKQMQQGMEERANLTKMLHEENRKTLGQIKLTLATMAGGGAVIAFLASDAGHNLMILLTHINNSGH